jgi:Tfp pilus assembly protein PilF
MVAARASASTYEVDGRIVPAAPATIALYGATQPFESSTLSDVRGRFRFRKLPAGTYTVSIIERNKGEIRKTIEVGPGVADPKGHVSVVLHLDIRKFEVDGARRPGITISALELSIPQRARHEYEQAQKTLARRDVPGTIAHLERAVELAPQYEVAWNELGTIAYQSRRFEDAERYFRRGQEADPQAYEPLVNLGGVLLNLGKLDEALEYNQRAVLRRPNDALANSQLGMAYLGAGKLDLAEKYLTSAKKLDPAHFSHPQLMLAKIHLMRNERAAAIDELQDFLKRHPDAPEAAIVKADIARLQR